AVPRVAKLRELSLEGLHHRSTDEPRSLQGCLEDRDEFLFQLLMRSHQVHQRDLFAGDHRRARVSTASDRRRRGGYSCTIELPGTSRVTALAAPIREFEPIVWVPRTLR